MEKRGRQKPSYNWYLGLLPGPGLGKRAGRKVQPRQEGERVAFFYTRMEQGGGGSTRDQNNLRIQGAAQDIPEGTQQRPISGREQRLVQKRSGRHSAIRVVYHGAKRDSAAKSRTV